MPLFICKEQELLSAKNQTLLQTINILYWVHKKRKCVETSSETSAEVLESLSLNQFLFLEYTLVVVSSIQHYLFITLRKLNFLFLDMGK